MSARGVLTVVGQAVGYYFGGPIGAVVGSVIGGAVGGQIDGPIESTDPIGNLSSPKLEYGGRLPRIYGRHRVAGYLAWASEKRATAIETEQGKGGPSAVSTSWQYSQDQLWLVAIDSPLIGISRVWRNKELIWSILDESDEASRLASMNTNAWAEIEFFDGNPAQLPWSVYETAVGSDNAVAYRHRSTIGITDAQFVNGEAPPLYEFEVYSVGDLTPGSICTWNPADKDPNVTLSNGDLTATNTTSDYGGIRTTVSVNSGKWYWEYTVTQLDTFDDGWVGIIGGVDGLANVIGAYNPRACVRSSGFLSQSGGTDGAIGLTYTEGDIVMIAFDADTADVWFGVNGLWYATGNPSTAYLPTGNADAGAGPFYPWVGSDNSAGTTSYTANFGPTFTYPKPAGFSAIQGDAPSVTIENVDLADVVEAEILRCGLVSGEYDVSELVGTEIIGFAAAGSPRQAIEQLGAIYWFDMAPGNRAVVRGGASIETVPFLETGAGLGSPGEPFTGLERTNDIETPIQVALSGPNVSADYEVGTQSSDRLVGSGADIRKVQSSVVMTPAMQKGRAESMVMDARVSSHTGSFTVSDDYIEIEPTDVITTEDREGNTYNVRVLRQTYSDGIWKNDVALDDASVLIESGITSENYVPAVTVAPVPDSSMIFLDGPIFRDADNTPGFYVAVYGSGNYPGFSVRRSNDGVDFSVEVARGTQSAIVGTASTALGAWDGHYVIDEDNTVTVSVNGELSSITEDAFQLDATRNAFAIGAPGRWEYINALTCTLDSPGIYTLSRLVRGRRGTEHATDTHATGDTVIYLNTALRRIEGTTSDIGLTRYYKALTLGQSSNTATAESFTDSSVGLECFSPVRLEATRDGGNNVTFTWTRRDRLAIRYGGPGGTYAPMSEATEAYSIDILDGPDVVRTITATSETETYSAADQTSDGLTPGDPVSAVVYQLSAVVGRGYPLEATV